MPPNPSTSRAEAVLLSPTQVISSLVLALIPILFLTVLGSVLLVAPSAFLRHILDCFQGNEELTMPSPSKLDLQLLRVMGGVFLGESLSSLAFLYPMMATAFSGTYQPLVSGNSKDKATMDKFRSVVASLSIIGLLLFLGGLVDDRSSDTSEDQACASIHFTFVIGIGAIILLFACGSLMVLIE